MILTMDPYLTGIVIVLMAIIAFMQIRLTRMIDTIGDMLHSFMFHPNELEAWSIVSSMEMLEKHEIPEDASKDWSQWDESGEADSEEE